MPNNNEEYSFEYHNLDNIDWKLNNTYVLDYNNELFKKKLKVKTKFNKHCGPIIIDVLAFFVLMILNSWTCYIKFGYTPTLSVVFIIVFFLFYMMIEFYIFYKKINALQEIDKTMVIKDEDKIILVKGYRAAKYPTTTYLISSEYGLTTSDDTIRSLMFISYIIKTFKDINPNDINLYKNKINDAVKNIAENTVIDYSFKRIEDCKIVKETKDYYIYSGNITTQEFGITKTKKYKFKLYKVYINAEELLNGGEL